MGGRSKASTASATTQKDTTSTLVDNSQGDGQRINTSSTVSGDNNTVTMSDQGAIAAGAAVAKDSIAAVTAGTGAALNFGRDALSFADAQGARAGDVMKSSLAQVSGLAAANEVGNRDTVKTLADLSMNLRSDGAAAQNKTVQTVVISLALMGVVIGGAVIWSKKAA